SGTNSRPSSHEPSPPALQPPPAAVTRSWPGWGGAPHTALPSGSTVHTCAVEHTVVEHGSASHTPVVAAQTWPWLQLMPPHLGTTHMPFDGSQTWPDGHRTV